MDTRSRSRNRERGSALVLALFLIVILTIMGLGLVFRSRVSMSVAGAERTITKNFYAADSGIHASYTHIKVNNPCPFTFAMTDNRGGAQYPIGVDVAEARRLGTPQRGTGSEVGGGISGGGVNLVYLTYRVGADAFEAATQTRREIEADLWLGPTTLSIPVPCSTSGSTTLPTPVAGP
jgi:hypothetical protein